MKRIAVLIFVFTVGCVTVPPEAPEPEPVPIPAPKPQIMGYEPGPDGTCSSRAAHDRPLSVTGLCYKLQDLLAWCQKYRYRANTEGACMAVGAGYDH